jgi:Type II secretion system (T2SS), protein E, N-terminal domain
MSASSRSIWLSLVQDRWHRFYPQCAQCSFGVLRRMWSGVIGRDGGIRLQGLRYCASRCFENAACECFSRAGTATPATTRVHHRIPLGLLMLSRGQLTKEQLREAIDAQTASGQDRLGDWLEKLGFATEQQVTAALGMQWSCPVLASRTQPVSTCAHMLPYRLLEHFRMLPVQFVAATRTLLVAFCDGIDHTALYSVEQMLNCRTQACVISHVALEQELERLGREPRPNDRLFDSCEPSEMARITCSYAHKLSAIEVRIAACGEYIWVRLEMGSEVATLLFRRPVGTAVSMEQPVRNTNSSPLRSRATSTAH